MAKPGRLSCGDPIGWAVRLRDGGKRYMGCLGCLFKKNGGLIELGLPTEIKLEPKPKETKIEKKKTDSK